VDGKLVKGETYITHNFKTVKNDCQYMVCEHPLELLLIRATFVKPQPIEKTVYEFESIKEVVADNFSSDLLIGMYHILNMFISLNNLLSTNV